MLGNIGEVKFFIPLSDDFTNILRIKPFLVLAGKFQTAREARKQTIIKQTQLKAAEIIDNNYTDRS